MDWEVTMAKIFHLSESDAAIAVLRILAAQPNGTATVKVLKEGLPKYATITEDDRAQSGTRPNEEIWEQRVRNIRSHHDREGNLFYEEYVDRPTRGVWSLTAVGRYHLNAL
jgi:hypothetical protein